MRLKENTLHEDLGLYTISLAGLFWFRDIDTTKCIVTEARSKFLLISREVVSGKVRVSDLT